MFLFRRLTATGASTVARAGVCILLWRGRGSLGGIGGKRVLEQCVLQVAVKVRLLALCAPGLRLIALDPPPSTFWTAHVSASPPKQAFSAFSAFSSSSPAVLTILFWSALVALVMKASKLPTGELQSNVPVRWYIYGVWGPGGPGGGGAPARERRRLNSLLWPSDQAATDGNAVRFVGLWGCQVISRPCSPAPSCSPRTESQ